MDVIVYRKFSKLEYLRAEVTILPGALSVLVPGANAPGLHAKEREVEASTLFQISKAKQ